MSNRIWPRPGEPGIDGSVPGTRLAVNEFRPPTPPLELVNYHLIVIGSSSSAALLTAAVDTGIPVRSGAWFINQWMWPYSTKAVKVYADSAGANIDSMSDNQLGNAGGTQVGSLDRVSVPWRGAIASGDGNETYIVQADGNATGSNPWGNPGSADVHASWVFGDASGAYGPAATHKGFGAQVNAAVLTSGRFVIWSYSDWSNGYGGGWGNFCTARMHRIVWNRYPGHHVDDGRQLWPWIPPSTFSDTPPSTSKRNGNTNALHFFDDWDAKRYEVNMRLPTYSLGDRSHLNNKGFATQAQWMHQAAEGMQGIGSGTSGKYCPFFPDHRYLVDNATARTPGGFVCNLGYAGDITGWTFALFDLEAGGSSPDFTVGVSGSNVQVSAIGGGGTSHTRDLLVVCQSGERVEQFHIEIGVSKGTAGRATHLDGHFGLGIFTADNTGNDLAPVFASAATCLTFSGGAGAPNAAAEGTFIFAIKPDADVDAQALQLVFASPANGTASTISIQRASNGSFSVTLKSSTGVTLGNISSNTTAGQGRVRNADGWKFIFYSFSIANNRQSLVIYDDATGAIPTNGSITGTVGSAADACLNPLSGGGLAVPIYTLFSGGSTSFQTFQEYKGWTGPVLAYPKEIQFAGANIGNVALFRATVGANATGTPQFTDLGTTGAVTPLTGANATVSITPYIDLNGDPNEMNDGANRGVGGQLECWQRRDPFRLDFLKGKPT